MPLSPQEQAELDDLELQQLEEEEAAYQKDQQTPSAKLMNTPYLQKVRQQVNDQLSPQGVEQLAASSLAPGPMAPAAKSILGKAAAEAALGGAQGVANAPEGREGASGAVGAALGGLLGGAGGVGSKAGQILLKKSGKAPVEAVAKGAASAGGKFDPFTKKAVGEAAKAAPKEAALSSDDLIAALLGSAVGGPGGGLAGVAARKIAQSPAAQAGAGQALQSGGNALSDPKLLTTLNQLLLGQKKP